MTEQESPRSRIKALLKGELPETPLVMPIVFAIGSRLENLPRLEFAKNPTKIANALRQIRTTLKLDVLCCYFDSFLEKVALQQANPGRGRSADELVSKGSVPVALEVLKRARLMLKDEPALMVRVTGPLTLASQLSVASGQLGDDGLLDFCGEVAASLTRAYLENGADVVLLVESSLPMEIASIESWASLMDPIINVVRFYDAVPVVVLGDDQFSPSVASVIAERSWECVLCPTLANLTVLWSGAWTNKTMMGIAVPVDTFTGMPTETVALQDAIANKRPVLLTTVDDIPVTADLKQVSAALERVRGALAR